MPPLRCSCGLHFIDAQGHILGTVDAEEAAAKWADEPKVGDYVVNDGWRTTLVESSSTPLSDLSPEERARLGLDTDRPLRGIMFGLLFSLPFWAAGVAAWRFFVR